MPNQRKSKEEILESNNAGGYVMDKRYRQLFGNREYLYNAMEQYAKQEAIAFGQYLLETHVNKSTAVYNDADETVWEHDNGQLAKTESLYTLFLTTKL